MPQPSEPGEAAVTTRITNEGAPFVEIELAAPVRTMSPRVARELAAALYEAASRAECDAAIVRQHIKTGIPAEVTNKTIARLRDSIIEQRILQN